MTQKQLDALIEFIKERASHAARLERGHPPEDWAYKAEYRLREAFKAKP